VTVTTLDPKTALIVVDLQKGIVGFPLAHPIQGILDKTGQLARAFRKRDLPVVLVNVSGMAPGRTDAGYPHPYFGRKILCCLELGHGVRCKILSANDLRAK